MAIDGRPRSGFTEELRECIGCACLVVMEGRPCTSGAIAWIADPHTAPCGLPCWTCALGSDEDVHHPATCPRCARDLQTLGNLGPRDVSELLETIETILDELEGSPILPDERARLRAILGRR